MPNAGLPPVGGNFPNSYYIPERYSLKVLKNYYASDILPYITNMDYSGDLKPGTKVHIRRDPRVTTVDHTAGAALSFQNITEEESILSIDYNKVSAVHLPDEEVDFSDLKIQEMVTRAMTDAHAQVLQDTVLGAVWSAAGGVAGALNWSTAGNPTKAITEASAILTTKNIDLDGRFLLLHPQQLRWLKQEEANFANRSGEDKGALIKGYVGMYDGMEVFVSSLVPGDGTAGNPYKSICGRKEAIAMAQVIKKLMVKDPADKLGKNVIGQTIFGFGVLQPDALVYIPGQTS